VQQRIDQLLVGIIGRACQRGVGHNPECPNAAALLEPAAKGNEVVTFESVATPTMARNYFGFGEPKSLINIEAGKDSSSFCYCGSASPRQDVPRESQSAVSTPRRARALFNYFNINQQEKNYDNDLYFTKRAEHV